MMKAGQEVLAPIWKSALEEALDRSAVFTDSSNRKASVAVKILKVDLPAFGISFTTDTSANYEVIDRSNGAILYKKKIDSEGTVPPDFAFAGVARARESVNRSVRNNIREFIDDLQRSGLASSKIPAASITAISKELAYAP